MLKLILLKNAKYSKNARKPENPCLPARQAARTGLAVNVKYAKFLQNSLLILLEFSIFNRAGRSIGFS